MKNFYWPWVFLLFLVLRTDHCLAQSEKQDYLRFGLSNLMDGDLGFTPGVWLGFSWDDQPWGAWNLQAGFGKAQHIERLGAEFSWEGRNKLSEKYQLVYNLGAISSIQKFNGQTSNGQKTIVEQNVVRALIAVGLERKIKSRVSIGLRMVVQSRSLHNFKEIDASQSQISQVVIDLDQSWPFSAQLGLSYLFD